MGNKKILIGTPICQEKMATWNEYVQCVRDIGCDVFLVETSKEPTLKDLAEFLYFNYDNVWADKVMDRVILARQKIIDYAKANKYDYLLFLDSDCIISPAQLNQLISDDKDIISGVCTSINSNGMPRPVPMISADEYMPLEWYDTGVKDVWAIGFGCALIKIEVFGKIEQLRCLRDNNGKIKISEDYCFSLDAVTGGYQVYVDTNIQVKHLMSSFTDWDNA